MKIIINCFPITEVEIDKGDLEKISYADVIAQLEYAKSLALRMWSEAQTEHLKSQHSEAPVESSN